MKECDRFENAIQALIAGNPKLEELEDLIRHCKICPDCRDLYEMHRTLAGFGSRFDEMEPTDFSEARRAIVQAAANNRRPYRRGFWSSLWTPFSLRPLTASALLAVVFAIGLFVARFGNQASAPSMDVADKAFIRASLRDIQKSPYTFSNVAVRYVDSNTVAVSFDIARRVSIVEPEHSEMVKRILLNSQFNPSFTGAVGHFQSIPAKDRVAF